MYLRKVDAGPKGLEPSNSQALRTIPMATSWHKYINLLSDLTTEMTTCKKGSSKKRQMAKQASQWRRAKPQISKLESASYPRKMSRCKQCHRPNSRLNKLGFGLGVQRKRLDPFESGLSLNDFFFYITKLNGLVIMKPLPKVLHMGFNPDGNVTRREEMSKVQTGHPESLW